MADNSGTATPISPLTLEGNVVRLEPISRGHVPLLWDATKGSSEDVFRWFPWPMRTLDEFSQYVDRVLLEQAKGVSVGFATVLRKSGRVVGSTRYMNMDLPNRHVEIGSTWIAPEYQRTGVNTEAKYLMLRHAFEKWNCLRVELKTDALNQKSRDAILRLGAKEEGKFRKHMVTWTGRVRDSVYFSIVDSEWPAIKLRMAEWCDG